MPHEANDSTTATRRRQALQAAAGLASVLLAKGAIAQAGSAQETPVPKPKIAMVLPPSLIAQDLVGPWTIFNLLRDADIHLVAKTLAPVRTDVGLPIAPTATYAECPRDLDILFVPGGLEGSIALMDDGDALAFLADRGSRARFVTSVCTGSLVLAAAGLLRGYRATSHWYVRDQLALMGAIPVHERVVRDRNRLTGGGVTAGIDFGLTLAGLLRGETAAELYQLLIEYAPQPPFNAGEPETAPRDIVASVLKVRGPVIEQARQRAERISRTFKG